KIHVCELLRSADCGDIPVSYDLGYGGTHHFRVRQLLANRRERIPGTRRIEKNPSHAPEAVPEYRQQRDRRVLVEQWNGGKRSIRLRPVGADSREDFITAAHERSPRFA